MIVAPVPPQLVTNTPLQLHFQYQLGAKNKAVVLAGGQKAPMSEEAEISHPPGAWGLFILQTYHQGSCISFFSSKIIQAHAVLIITDDGIASCSHQSLDGPMLGHQDAGIGTACQALTVPTQV